MDSMDSMGSIGSSATGYRPPVKFNKSFSNVTIGSGVEDNERFVSTQKKFYPPIIYEPSKAPRRYVSVCADGRVYMSVCEYNMCTTLY